MNFRIIEYRPPKIAQIFVFTAALLHWVMPGNQLYLYSNHVLAGLLGITAFSVMMWGWWLFKKYETAICPTAKTDWLVTAGIYRYTRNPMYLGVIGMLLAVSVFVGTLPFYIATLVYFVVINNVFCPYEEHKLEETFGHKYLSYKKNVRRWL